MMPVIIAEDAAQVFHPDAGQPHAGDFPHTLCDRISAGQPRKFFEISSPSCQRCAGENCAESFLELECRLKLGRDGLGGGKLIGKRCRNGLGWPQIRHARRV